MGGRHYVRVDYRADYAGMFPPCPSYLDKLLAKPTSASLVNNPHLKEISTGLEKIVHVVQQDLHPGISPRGRQYPFLEDFKQFCASQQKILSGVFLLQYARNIKLTVDKLKQKSPITAQEKDVLCALMIYVVKRAKKQEVYNRVSKKVRKPSRIETGSTFDYSHYRSGDA
ncbi:MAG: hypothetical protein AABY01_04485 [Nanoarchaeota archaeon]